MESEERSLREKALALVRRAEADEAFARRAKADPYLVLIEAGIPHTDAEDMLRVTTDEFCTDGTCLTSECPGTCFVSIVFHE